MLHVINKTRFNKQRLIAIRTKPVTVYASKLSKQCIDNTGGRSEIARTEKISEPCKVAGCKMREVGGGNWTVPFYNSTN